VLLSLPVFEERRHRSFEEAPAAERIRPVLELGRVAATPGALAALVEAHESGQWYLQRHACGDWGVRHDK
jgi:hypothetical protein